MVEKGIARGVAGSGRRVARMWLVGWKGRVAGGARRCDELTEQRQDWQEVAEGRNIKLGRSLTRLCAIR